MQATKIKRTPVNPWPWSTHVGYNQAEIVEHSQRQLMCAGQTSVDENGQPLHGTDMRQQMIQALKNLEAVLAGAEMNLSHVVHLRVYSTDVDATLQHFDVLGSRFGAFEVMPPMSLLGVTRLAMPELAFEIEATAAD